MGKRRKTQRQKAVDAADREFSLYIRERDRFRSVLSGKTSDTDVIQCGHVFTRANYATRWDENNAFATTRGENFRHEHDPWPLYSYCIDLYGFQWFKDLYRKHKTSVRYTTADIQELARHFKEKRNSLQQQKDSITSGAAAVARKVDTDNE